MSVDNGVLDLSFEAMADFTDYQYRFVVIAGKVVTKPVSSSMKCIGVLQNAPNVGEAARVRVMGVSKIELGGTISSGKFVKHNVAAGLEGTGIEADQTNDLACGLCIEGGDAGELGTVILSGTPQYVNPA